MRDGFTTRTFGRTSAAAVFEAPAAEPQSRYSRWRLRDWGLRTKLTALLVVPLILAGVLGTLRVTDQVRGAQDFAALARQVGLVERLDLVVHDLQGERHWVAVMLATGAPSDRAALQARVRIQFQRVDTAAASLRTADFTAEPPGPVAARDRPIVDEVDRAAVSLLSGVAALRQAALGSTPIPGKVTASSAVTAYSELIAALLDLDRRVLDGVPAPVAHQVDGFKALSLAKEQAALQHTVLLTGILSGGLSSAQQAMLRTAEARLDDNAEWFSNAMSPAQRRLYFDTMAAGDRKRLLVAVLERATRGAPLETVPGDWNSVAAETVETIHQGIDTLLNELRTDAQARGAQAWGEAFWDGAAVAALLLLAVALLVVVVRSLLEPLRTLRTAAFEVADRRLPQLVEQVLATDGTPAAPTVDPVPVHSREEVGQVARAFDSMHIQAVRLAAEQAQLRSSLNDVFLNMSGRGQRLLEQHLRLIEELRGAVHDPELVSSVRRLDRLGARMRRHSDTLLVLAGGAARRDAEEPVAVLDVLSNAVTEIDEYERVTVCPPPAATVAGPVAGDLVHLISELLDNAISVTPGGSMVTLSCALTEDKSLQVEITDSGAGLPADELEAINARLVSAPAPDSSAPGQMGLVVARELAEQHGITVQLRQRLGERGITATALLPPSLVTVDLRVSTDSPRSADEPPTTRWSGAEEQLPLQVSMVDEATAADLFSPSSLGIGISAPSRPRTAQEEWLELFGHHTSAPEPPSGDLEGDQPTVAAAEQPGEVREEIFEIVSAWFRERQSAPVSDPSSTVVSPTVVSPTVVSEWRSPFDEGWRAAQALRTRVDHELTNAGLPKRRPRAHLVSGADGRVLPTPVPAGPARTPEAVRGRLTRYQRGLRVGRHARIGPEEQFAWADIPQRPLDK